MVNVPNAGVPITGALAMARDWYSFLTDLNRSKFPVDPSAAEIAAMLTTLTLAGANYTPTGTGVTNVDSVTPAEANYIRVGSSVFVSFYAAVDATLAAATTTVFALSLPIASALTSSRQLSGVGTTAGVWQTVDIEGDATNDRASLRYTSPVTTAIAITGIFGYRIL